MGEIDDIDWDFGPNSADANLDPVPYTVKCKYCGMDGHQFLQSLNTQSLRHARSAARKPVSLADGEHGAEGGD